jgi:hypothetical protein
MAALICSGRTIPDIYGMATSWVFLYYLRLSNWRTRNFPPGSSNVPLTPLPLLCYTLVHMEVNGMNGALAVRANEISNDFIQSVKNTYKTQRVVVLAEKEYQKMQNAKERHNAEYLAKLAQSTSKVIPRRKEGAITADDVMSPCLSTAGWKFDREAAHER